MVVLKKYFTDHNASTHIFYPIGKKSGFDQNVIDWTCAASSKDRHSQSIDIMDGSSMIGNMRLIKDDHEIEIMKKACDISAESFVEVMKNIKPGENEQLVESKFLYEFLIVTLKSGYFFDCEKGSPRYRYR